MAHYGTAFEQLSDEERNAITKKPKAIQDEIVTDEKGRRRFHGAFTGGFSAGYFNTAGSKHGWVPQTFKSSRETRAEKTDFAAEDFMDEEDLGEFGIAAKKLRTKTSFMDSLSQPGESNMLAWERSTAVLSSTTAATDVSSIASRLTEILRPVNDSVGVRLLKKMGWREGKGIGPTMSRRALEKQKVVDAKSRGETADFDVEVVEEIESRVPNVEFAPDDVSALFFDAKDNAHGLGYNPLQESSALVQNYGSIATGLKTSKKGKAIRGQAFGVGAFEDDDEDIYTSFDLSQYDFEIGAGTSAKTKETARFDSSFVPAKKTTSVRKFFPGLNPPHNFRPVHKTGEIKTQNLPNKILQIGEKMTPFQRAKFLGDRDQSVMELLTDRDRQFLDSVKTETRKATLRESEKAKSNHRRVNEGEPFEEEPIKAHRFKKYVSYLRRGIYFEQPIEMTRLEWADQLTEFQNALTPELRALLPEVRSRQQPLAKIDFAQPIAEQLNSRFQKESNDGDERVKITKDHDLVQAVKMKMFGDATRKKFTWHPSKELCKRFNVPNPYPDSCLVGVPELQKRIKSAMDSFAIMNTGLQTTEQELESKRSKVDTSRGIPQMENKPQTSTNEFHLEKGDQYEKPPWELMKALFENETSSEEEEEKVEEVVEIDDFINQTAGSMVTSMSLLANRGNDGHQPSTSFAVGDRGAIIFEKVVTVMDLIDDDDVFGPALPPEILTRMDVPSSAIASNKDMIDKKNGINRGVSTSPQEELSDKEQRTRKKHTSKNRKEKHRDSKKEKHKKKKSKKSKHRTSGSDSSSSVEVLVDSRK